MINVIMHPLVAGASLASFFGDETQSIENLSKLEMYGAAYALATLAMAFLANPCKLYKNGSFAMKRLVLRLAFQGPVTYTKETGVRTAQPSVIFGFFGKITSKCEMVQKPLSK